MGHTAMAVAAGETDNDDDTLALDDLEISELNAAYDAEQTPADELEAPSEVSISLDLEDTSPLTELVEEPTDTVSEEVPDPIQLDDLDSIEFDMPEAEAEAEVADSVAAEVDSLMTESLDLDSMMAEAEAAVDSDESELSLDSEFSADDLQAQLDELSDLSVLDSELNDAPETTGQEASRPVLGLVEEDTVAGGDGLDQPIDLVEVLAEDDREAQSAKLDLARAYVDMGDEEGARSILEEVVAEGSDAQRGDAETILAKLG